MGAEEAVVTLAAMERGADDHDAFPGDEEPFAAHPPEPQARAWRHPSELTGPATAPGPQTRLPRRHLGDRRAAPAVAAAIAAVLVLGALGVVAYVDRERGREEVADLTVAPGGAARTTSELLDAVAPGVLAVIVIDASGTRRASGVCVRRDGDVLTSAAVVGTAPERVEIVTADGVHLDAALAGSDLATGLALLTVDRPIAAATLSGAAVETGDDVWVVAAPAREGTSAWFGRGRVQATDAMHAGREGPTWYGLLEADVTLPGHGLGSALADERGRVVGVVVAATPEAPAVVVPVDVATDVAAQLRSSGAASHGALGLQGVDTPYGPFVTGVADGGSAASGGLQAGDVIVAVGGHEVTTMAEVTALVRSREPGSRMTVTVRRGEETHQLGVALSDTARRGLTARP